MNTTSYVTPSRSMASGIVIGASLLLGVSLGTVSLFLLIPAALIAGMVQTRHVKRLVLLVVAGVILGTIRGSVVEGEASSMRPSLGEDVIGVVASLPVGGGESERVLLRIELTKGGDGTWSDTSGTVVTYLSGERHGASLGDRVQVRWDYTDVRELAPGYAGYVRSLGAIGSAWVYTYEVIDEGPGVFNDLASFRRTISDVLLAALPGDSGALAAGFVTGDDSALQASTERAFQKTGTGHLTSVSGQNIALLTSFLAIWYRPASLYRRLMTHSAMLTVVWTYALIVGLQPPTLRAALVATLTIIGTYSGRKPDPLTLLSLTLGAMAIIDPGHTHSVGFWLSASASFALCSVIPTDVPDGIRRQLLTLMMGPLAATLATLPFVIWTFQEWSPLAPVTNAILMPIMNALFPVVYFFTGIALIWHPAASALSWIPGIGLDLTISIVQRMSDIAPTLYLDGAGPGTAVLVGIPCIACILAMGRDGDRWVRIVHRAVS
jgi:ComEC/Rec2-related protein